MRPLADGIITRLHDSFQMRHRISIRGSVRPSVGPLVGPSVRDAFVKIKENQYF